MSNKYKDKVLEFAALHKENYGEDIHPIYRILLFEHPAREAVSKHGKPLGWPDTGLRNATGFYYELDTAIQAMHENWTDIHETCYFAGFVICTFPGLYPYGGPEARIYFEWDEEKRGFFEADEPEIYEHWAYYKSRFMKYLWWRNRHC